MAGAIWGLGAPKSIAAIQFMIDLAQRYGVLGPFSAGVHGEALFVLCRAAIAVVS